MMVLNELQYSKGSLNFLLYEVKVWHSSPGWNRMCGEHAFDDLCTLDFAFILSVRLPP